MIPLLKKALFISLSRNVRGRIKPRGRSKNVYHMYIDNVSIKNKRKISKLRMKKSRDKKIALIYRTIKDLEIKTRQLATSKKISKEQMRDVIKSTKKMLVKLDRKRHMV